MDNVYDKINAATFREQGDNGTYICSCCGKMTTLSDSVSSQGYNLVCTGCRYMLKRILGITDEIIQIQEIGAARRVANESEND